MLSGDLYSRRRGRRRSGHDDQRGHQLYFDHCCRLFYYRNFFLFERMSAMEKKVIISVKNLVKSFDTRKVLEGVSLDIYQGETFVIMGGSGCGKSTILRHMIGAIKPDAGQVFFDNRDLATLSEDEEEKVKRRFGMCFQSAALLDYLNVEDNVSLPLTEHTSLDPKIISVIVKMKLNLVGLQG